jgi:O-antigen/teichoic acid export membrane protein
MSMAKKAAKVGKLSTIYVIGSMLPQFLGILVLPIFTRYMDREQYGIVGLAGTYIGFLGILIQMGLWSGLKSRYFHVDEDQRASLVRTIQVGQFLTGIVLSVVLSLVGLFWISELLPNLPLDTAFKQMLWLLIVWGSFAMGVVFVTCGVAQIREQATTAVSINLTQWVSQVLLGLTIVISLYYLGARGYLGFGRQVSVFLGALLGALLGSFHMWRAGRGGAIHWREFWRTWRVGITFIPHSAAVTGARLMMAWLVTSLLGPGEMGIYSIAILFAALLELPLNAIANAAYPTLAGLMRDGSEDARRQQVRFYGLIISGTIFLVLSLKLLAPIAIQILVAPQFCVAIGINAILLIAWVFQGFYLVVSQPIFFKGGGQYMAMATVISLLVMANLAIWLIPEYGLIGAAMTMIGSYLVRFLIAAYFSHRIYPLKWRLGPIGVMLLVATGVACLDGLFLRELPCWMTVPIKLMLLAGMLPMFVFSGLLKRAEWDKVEARLMLRLKLRREPSNPEP